MLLAVASRQAGDELVVDVVRALVHSVLPQYERGVVDQAALGKTLGGRVGGGDKRHLHDTSALKQICLDGRAENGSAS